jgi:uncharacterized protein
VNPVSPAQTALSAEDCLGLLRTRSIGRIAYTDRAMPAIGLVRYSVVNGAVLLRSDHSLPIGLQGAVIAFQADDLDGASAQEWSVTCVGKLAAVPGLDDVLILEPTLVQGWRTVHPAAIGATPEAVPAS